jgi:uncharacterized protein YaiI (UPF0178 family)
LKILVDADACPVKKIIESVAAQHQVKLILVSNPHHRLSSEWGEVMTVDPASQSADITIANLTREYDIVVTQDYGLAAMVLGKKAAAINHSGMVYTIDNIDALLMQRYLNAKARQRKEKIKGPKKRSAADNLGFETNFIKLVTKMLATEK